MALYLLRMYEMVETKGRTVFQRNHYFEVELDDNLDSWERFQFAKNKYPHLQYGDYIPVKTELPDGWKKLDGALTAPNGYYWASNGKSLFSKDYDSALIKEQSWELNPGFFSWDANRAIR